MQFLIGMFIHFVKNSSIAETTPLKLAKLVVPSMKYRNENILLECQYELNNRSINNERRGYGDETRYYRKGNNYLYDNEDESEEVLYSVKWYKDDEEFYRFVPRANPPQHSYSFDGIKVDVSRRNDTEWKGSVSRATCHVSKASTSRFTA